MGIISTVIVIICIAAAVLDFAAQRAIPARVEQLYLQGRYTELLDCTDSWIGRHVLAPYARESARFAAFVGLGDATQAEATLERATHMPLTPAERADLAEKRLTYAVSCGNSKEARKVLREIDKLDDKALAYRCHMLYDISLEGSTAYIADLEAALPEAKEPARSQLLYLLALQHENAGNQEQAAFMRSQLQGAS